MHDNGQITAFLYDSLWFSYSDCPLNWKSCCAHSRHTLKLASLCILHVLFVKRQVMSQQCICVRVHWWRFLSFTPSSVHLQHCSWNVLTNLLAPNKGIAIKKFNSMRQPRSRLSWLRIILSASFSHAWPCIQILCMCHNTRVGMCVCFWFRFNTYYSRRCFFFVFVHAFGRLNFCHCLHAITAIFFFIFFAHFHARILVAKSTHTMGISEINIKKKTKCLGSFSARFGFCRNTLFLWKPQLKWKTE